MSSSSPEVEKVDLLAQHRDEYVAPKKPALISTKPATYLRIEGSGCPGGDLFGAQVGALYGLAFTVKMTRKFSGRTDYTVGKLEARWLKMGTSAKSDDWRWEILIRTPDFVTPVELKSAAGKLLAKGQPTAVADVSLTKIDEGDCVQMLHLGPYDREAETFGTMIAFAKNRGFAPAGPHHEIYLSDPRRVPPEKLRTILRLPVSRKS